MKFDLHTSWEKLVTKMTSWIEHLIVMLPNTLLAVIVLVIFVLVAKFARKGFVKVVNQLSDNYAINHLLGRFIQILTMMIGIFVILSILKLDKTVTSLLAGAGIVGLAIGFAFQDMIANLISGVMIAVRKPFKKGDLIETNSYFGTVIGMDLRNTIIRVPQGQQVIIPNKDVFQKAIKNYATGERRIDLGVGVSYSSDLPTVEEIAKKAVSAIPYISKTREVELHYTAFGDSSINFLLLYWIDLSKQQDFFRAQSDGIKRVKAAFDEHDITIPFPIRTLELSTNSQQLSGKQTDGFAQHISNY